MPAKVYKEPRYRSFLDKWELSEWARRSTGVPAGWCDVVDRLMTNLSQVPGWDPEFVLQIKSKFACLSFYYNLPENADATLKERVEALVGRAEQEALAACEGCGTTEGVKRGSIGSGWLVNECPTCFDESNNGDRRFR